MTTEMYFFSVYEILLEESSVAVRLIGSRLFSAKNSSASCPWFFTQFFLVYYHYKAGRSRAWHPFWSTNPLFFLLDSFPIFLSAFSILQNCVAPLNVTTPVQVDLLGTVGCTPVSRRTCCKVQWWAWLCPKPSRSRVFLGAVSVRISW